MPSYFYRRRWAETRGDEFNDWGCSVWYFEVGNDGRPVRQVEMYDAGPVLRYGAVREEDGYGSLGQASLYDSSEDWDRFEIPREEFERAWGTGSDEAAV